jgi:F0F1-type ATP synthase alpha subunit
MNPAQSIHARRHGLERHRREDWRLLRATPADVGTVISIGDGIAGVSGVERAMLGFPNGVFGITLNLEEDCVGGVRLGASTHITEVDVVLAPERRPARLRRN